MPVISLSATASFLRPKLQDAFAIGTLGPSPIRLVAEALERRVELAVVCPSSIFDLGNQRGLDPPALRPACLSIPFDLVLPLLADGHFRGQQSQAGFDPARHRVERCACRLSGATIF